MPGVDILATAFNGANAAFIADLYAKWVENPSSVDPSFAELFSALNDESRAVLTDASGASWAPRPHAFGEPAPTRFTPGFTSAEIRAAARDSLRVFTLIRSYRVRGHLEAKLDPLGLQLPKHNPELDPGTHGFTEADMDRPIYIDGVLGLDTATPRQILRILRESYCGPVGVEFMHIQDPDQKEWIQSRIEGAPWRTSATAETRRTILQQLTEAEGLEAFCQKRFVTTKRFGLEGAEVSRPWRAPA
jgi:2-oxoglutarate dehydrogenase E1 component